jgi:hypothetical protein
MTRTTRLRRLALFMAAAAALGAAIPRAMAQVRPLVEDLNRDPISPQIAEGGDSRASNGCGRRNDRRAPGRLILGFAPSREIFADLR